MIAAIALPLTVVAFKNLIVRQSGKHLFENRGIDQRLLMLRQGVEKFFRLLSRLFCLRIVRAYKRRIR